MRTYHIPIFVPHKGCPNDCVFCNQRKITGQIEDVTKEDVLKIIEGNLKTISPDSYVEVAFFGGSFTGIDTEKQTELLKAAYSYLKSGKIDGIRCSTRADYIDDNIISNLKKYAVTTVELGVQSTDDFVLKCSKRGHTFQDVVEASRKIKDAGINLGLQMMLGLPGDTREKMVKTAKDLITLMPDCVRIYPTLVVEDTHLQHMYQRGEYTPLELEETVDILAEIIPMFHKSAIKIIRVGLQTTDNINEKTVKGPYHPAIRELANGRIIRNLIEDNLSSGVNEVCVCKKHISETIGHSKCNKIYFREKYNVCLVVSEDNSLSEYEIKINGKILAIYQ